MGWITAFSMAFGMFCAIPFPVRRWDERQRARMLVCFPWVGAIIGVISTLLIVAAFVVKDGEKETGFERNMKDSEIMQRLMDYAKPFYRQFIVVGFLMLFSIAYDIISPLIVGKIEEFVVGKFALNTLFLWVAGYAAILLVFILFTNFILSFSHKRCCTASPAYRRPAI